MANIQYNISRNNGVEIEEYYADPSLSSMPAICAIRGGNSSGKSTSLNLIALAMGGDTNAAISGSLRERINALNDKSHQTISYDITLDNKDKVLSLSCNKDGKISCSYTEDGVVSNLTPEDIKTQFRLIYDIPEDPTQRLSQLTNTVSAKQDELAAKVHNFSKQLSLEIKDIASARDDDTIAEYLKQKQIAETEKQSKKEECKALIDYREKLTKYQLLQKYDNILAKLNECSDRVLELEKQNTSGNSAKKSQNAVSARSLSDARTYLANCTGQSKHTIAAVAPLHIIPQDKLKTWSLYDFSTAAASRKISQNILDIIHDAARKTMALADEQKKHKADIDSCAQIDSFIARLEKLQSEGSNMPDIVAALDGIKVMLNNKKPSLPENISNYSAVSKALDEFRTLNTYIDDAKQALSKLGNGKTGSVVTTSTSIQAELDKARTLLAQLKASLATVEKNCNLKNFVPYNKEDRLRILGEARTLPDFGTIQYLFPEDLLQKADEKMTEITKLNSRIAYLEDRISHLGKRISELQLHQPHKYSGRAAEVSAHQQTCMEIERKLANYKAFLKTINTGEGDTKKQDDAQFEKYNDSISGYLGSVMGEIAHGDKKYAVSKVDLIKKIFYTNDGRQIHFSDMGTGQSQSAYLLSQLNSASGDNRPMVVLFDEIAMMDESSLKPIYAKLHQLYDEGKLLAGITVMASRGGESGIEVMEI